MKSIFIIICLLLAGYSWSQTVDEWQQIGTEFVDANAYYPAMEFDRTGSAWYAYSNNMNNSSLNVLKMDAMGIVQIGPIDMTSGAFIRNKAIAFDTLGVPIVAFVDGTNNLTVVKLNSTGSDFDTLGVANFASTDGTNYRISMTLDSVSNQPVVAYRDYTTNKLCVQTFDGSNWVYFNGGQDISVGNASLIDISSGYSDLIFVACADGGKADTALVWQTHNTSTQWYVSSNDSIASNGPVVSLEVDAYDYYPSVAYINASDNNVYLHRLSGAPIWYEYGEPIGIADFYTDIAIQRTGLAGEYAYVGYADTDELYGPTTKRVQDADFFSVYTEQVDQPGFDNATAEDIVFGFDNQDSLYVAFGSPVTGVKVFKLRTISTIGANQNDLVDFHVYPNPVMNDNGQVVIASTIENPMFEIYALNGQVVLQGQLNSNKIISLEDVSKGTYFIKVYNDKTFSCEKLIIK